MTTKISWTERTWNPVTGCTKVSPGCANCYAERIDHRFDHDKVGKLPWAFPESRGGRGVTLHPERLEMPIHWAKPSRVFVNSMSDLFHEDVPDWFIHRCFGVMARAPQHTYQVLTKRPERMRDISVNFDWRPWPLPNVWLGVSVENQLWADRRIPLLLETPAAVRFISAEPLLGPVDLSRYLGVNPIHEQAYEEYRRLCLSCGYQWRTGNRQKGPDLEESQERMGQMEQMRPVQSMRTGEGRTSSAVRLLANQGDVQEPEIQRFGASVGVSPLLWADSYRFNDQSQEWEEIGQSAGESRASNRLSAAITRRSCAQDFKAGTSEWRSQFNEQAYRCPSCRDSATPIARGAAYLHSDGFWHNLPDSLQDCERAAPLISWTITGCESGPKRRPMDTDWARNLRDQCQSAGVPFFLKQMYIEGKRWETPMLDGRAWVEYPA